jgi:hypothetical protein
MRDHYLDAPNLDTVREPHGRSRLFLEDDPPMRVEDDASMSVRRQSTASAVFLFAFVVVAGVSAALAWRSYGDQATDLIRAWAIPTATSKPTAPPESFAELQQQLKSIAVDLAAVKHASSSPLPITINLLASKSRSPNKASPCRQPNWS